MIQIIKTGVLVLIVGLFLIFYTNNVYAMSLTISNLPSTFDQSQEAEVNLLFECSGCGDVSYIRGVFYPNGINYSGLTQNNNGTWIGSSADRTQYFTITKNDMPEATWSGKLKVKVDVSDPSYTGPGDYFFKVGRYTSANDSSADWSNELNTKITGPTIAPTPVPTPTPLKTSTPTAQPTALPTKTPTPTPRKTVTPLAEATSASFETAVPQATLIDAVESPQPTGSVLGITQEKNKMPIIAIIIIVTGVGFIGLAGYLAFKYNKNTDV